MNDARQLHRARHGRRSPRARLATTLVGLACVGAACLPSPDGGSGNGNDNGLGSPDDGCVQVPMAVSSEKITLLEELAATFNESDQADLDGSCVTVRPTTKSSGAAAQLVAEGWPNPDINGEQPVIWSPAASAWGSIANQRAGSTVAPPGTPFMLTPLVIAMPQPMAEALGWPDKAIGFGDLVELSKNAEGWASAGHPEWGPFRLGKTNPNYSTSGLNFTIAEYYAATGKTSGLTNEDLQRPDAIEFAADVESAVVHYGDITMTFLNNWFAADARGTSLTYASAVAVEEKSVIDYNMGNPDGVLSPGEVPRQPRVPLVAIYPSEGTLYSDNPFIVLDTPWVSEDQKAAAAKFEAFVQQPENQAKVLEFGFRPNNPSVALAAPVDASNGVDPNQPNAELQVPEPPVLVNILNAWDENRKNARVLLVLDVSGSMGDPASDDGTKLDLAKQAALNALDDFKDTDEVGLWVFTTDLLGAEPPGIYREVVPVAPISANRQLLADAINSQFPQQGTPLYDVTDASYSAMVASYSPDDINAIVLLTDGVNDDGVQDDDDTQFQELISSLQSGSEGAQSQPVRIFTIGYGGDADTVTLKAIANATAAAYYDASNPETINQVFTAVISNF